MLKTNSTPPGRASAPAALSTKTSSQPAAVKAGSDESRIPPAETAREARELMSSRSRDVVRPRDRTLHEYASGMGRVRDAIHPHTRVFAGSGHATRRILDGIRVPVQGAAQSGHLVGVLAQHARMHLRCFDDFGNLVNATFTARDPQWWGQTQQILADPAWAGSLGDAARRSLTPPFWSNINPYGPLRLGMSKSTRIRKARRFDAAGRAMAPRFERSHVHLMM